ncbi:MAG: NUDIX hydrolase [Paenisporosarcina sp.]
MFHWKGAAGVCINEHNRVLMVLQAGEDEEAKWSIPSGGIESNETFEECCVREMKEETGLNVQVISKIHDKNGSLEQYSITYELQYYLVEIVSGELTVQDPDEFIINVAWKSIEELDELPMSYPEDAELLKELLKNTMTITK